MKTLIQYSNFDMTVTLMCCEDAGGRNKLYDFVKKEWKEYSEGAIIPDNQFLKIPLKIYDSLAEAIQNDSLAPKPRKEYLEGKIEATEKHLEDMRSIVFEENKIEKEFE